VITVKVVLKGASKWHRNNLTFVGVKSV
jgi:hypothetical protein